MSVAHAKTSNPEMYHWCEFIQLHVQPLWSLWPSFVRIPYDDTKQTRSLTSLFCFVQAEETVPVKTERAAQSKHGGNVAHSSSIKQQSSSQMSTEKLQKEASSTAISIEAGDSENSSSASVAPDPSAGATSSTWMAMKTSLLNFRASMGPKRFLRLSQSSSLGTNASATETLDEIFQRLKRHSSNVDYLDDEGLP